MKIQLWSIGNPHEKYIRDGVEDFTNRISRYFKVEWVIIPPMKNAATLSEADVKKLEGDTIIGWLKEDDYLILLDERGKHISSEELSAVIQQRANESAKRLVF